MNIGSVFSDSKWGIIKDLSEQKLSPLQLANKYDTTMGNVGHQLRLLEAYGLIKKEKVSNREKGKPRTLFSLAYDCAYLVSATKGFADRKLLKLSDYHDTILKMWFVDDSRIHYYLEKFYWKIEDHIEDINGMAIIKYSDSDVDVVILTDAKKELKEKIGKEMVIGNKNKEGVRFNIQFLSKDQLKSLDLVKDLHIIYDPNNVLSCYKKSFDLV
ncbi:MAG: hypothetical protein U9O94_04760 [Nanoarchaeota archaeon]|nr:hypothetical protein [Nanoarchaeota archaeon]